MSGSGGGGGGSGTQKYEWNDSIAPFWGDALETGKALSKRPLERYTGQRIAGLNQDQQNSMDNTRTFLYQLQNPSKAINAGIGQTEDTLNGDYLTGYGGKGDTYAASGNRYAGDNPHFRQSLNNTLEDTTNAYKQGTSADTTRMAVMSGAFGGSAHQNAVANNENALAKQLGNIANTANQQQYDRSAGLEESWLNRGSGAYQQERGRQMGAMGQAAGLQGQALQRAQAEMGIGDIQRANLQDYLNLDYGDWQEGQNYPYKQLDMMTGLLSRAQGGMSPNMTSTMPGYSASPYSGLLGAGLMAYAGMGK